MCGKGDFATLCLLAGCMLTVAIICTVAISSNDWSRLNFRDVDEKGRTQLCDMMRKFLSYFRELNLVNMLMNICKNFMTNLPTDNVNDGSKAQRFMNIGLPWTDWSRSNVPMKVGLVCIGLGTAIVWFFAIITVLSLVFNVNKDNLLKRYCFYMLGLSIAFLLLFAGLMLIVGDRYGWRANEQVYDVGQICKTLYRIIEETAAPSKSVPVKSVSMERQSPCSPENNLVQSIILMLTPTTTDKPHIGIDVTLIMGFYLCLLANLLLLLPILLTLVLYICGKRLAKSRARSDANTLDGSRSRSRSPSSYARKKRQQRTDAV